MTTHNLQPKLLQNSFASKSNSENSAAPFRPQANLADFQIKYLKDPELHLNLQNLVLIERRVTHKILLHLMEVDRRKLYVQMAYPSMWEYLVKGIGYSAPAAQKRIDAARLMVQVPDLGKRLEAGCLSLNQVAILQKTFRDNKKLMKTFLPAEKKQELVGRLENKTLSQSQAILAEAFQLPIETREKKKTQRDESLRIEMTLAKEEVEFLEQAQSKLSHALLKEKDLSYKTLMLYSVKRTLKAKGYG